MTERKLWSALLEDDWKELNTPSLHGPAFAYGPVPSTGKVYVKNTLTGQMGIGPTIGLAWDRLKVSA